MFRRTRYQYYTNVNYLTCERCLGWHGAIRRNLRQFPDPSDGCERSVLPVRPRELRACREKGRRMRDAARAEIQRRRLFEEGLDTLPDDAGRAIASFRQAAGIDVYIPDLERLIDRHRTVLELDTALRGTLRGVFVKAFSDKFGRRRYERLPEPMRLQRERAGIERIHELFR